MRRVEILGWMNIKILSVDFLIGLESLEAQELYEVFVPYLDSSETASDSDATEVMTLLA